MQHTVTQYTITLLEQFVYRGLGYYHVPQNVFLVIIIIWL